MHGLLREVVVDQENHDFLEVVPGLHEHFGQEIGLERLHAVDLGNFLLKILDADRLVAFLYAVD